MNSHQLFSNIKGYILRYSFENVINSLSQQSVEMVLCCNDSGDILSFNALEILSPRDEAEKFQIRDRTPFSNAWHSNA